MTTTEKLEKLIRHGFGIGWLAKHKMFWAFQFDETNDRKIGWLSAKKWQLPTDVCADDTFSAAVSRTYENLIDGDGNAIVKVLPEAEDEDIPDCEFGLSNCD